MCARLPVSSSHVDSTTIGAPRRSEQRLTLFHLAEVTSAYRGNLAHLSNINKKEPSYKLFIKPIN